MLIAHVLYKLFMVENIITTVSARIFFNKKLYYVFALFPPTPPHPLSLYNYNDRRLTSAGGPRKI